MPELLREPAQTYQLNVLASALGRFASPDIDQQSIQQATELTDQVVESIREEPKPLVPHTNPVLLEEAAAFDAKLYGQLTRGRAATFLPRSILGAATEIVLGHKEACTELRGKDAPTEMLVAPAAIAEAYGLTDLWDGADALMRDEATTWASFRRHPEVTTDLQRTVSLDETRDLMRLMWRHVIEAPAFPDVNTYLTDTPEHFHVFWAPMSDSLDYATPRAYDRATQLSFDLPHNATHLAHLDALRSRAGVFRYDDSMALRAYFEAATVFSEYKTIDQARTNGAFVDELHAIINPAHMSKEDLGRWVADDRGYEFKLRAARYAADVLMINGQSFVETTHEVAALLDIPMNDAEKETRKYLAWTGLGAVYSFGYRKLRELGTERVMDVLVDDAGNAVSSWKQKLGQES
jgi:hypothetical protein